MTNPATAYYGCQPGGSIAAGRFIAPSIAGLTWTPAYDSSGNVLAGNWIGLPLNTWLYANVPTMATVLQAPAYNGSSGEDAIMDAWNGAAWDYATQKMYIDGGGHGDTSACETGVYSLDVAKMAFARVKDRSPLSALQSWNAATTSIDATEHHDAKNVPLLDGAPGAIHTYNGLLWVPPSLLGNTKGGMLYLGNAKAVLNLDTLAWTTCHYNDLATDFNTFGNSTALLDGDTVYSQDSSYWHRTFKLGTTQATSYSATSYGTFTPRAVSHAIATEGGGMWSWLRERREEVSFTQAAGFSRMRYGQAIDAAATDWNAYQDAITLTSADGSHSDFNTTNLSENTTVALEGMFTSCGSVYDHATQTLYVQGNKVGSQLYKITGLSGNTWTTQKLAGTGALELCTRGTYGRMRLATLGGKKVIIRVSSVRSKPQVMRIS